MLKLRVFYKKPWSLSDDSKESNKLDVKMNVIQKQSELYCVSPRIKPLTYFSLVNNEVKAVKMGILKILCVYV